MSEASDQTDEPVAESAIRAARPAPPASAAQELRRRRLAATMFGAADAPVRFGRFVLLARVGAGAMGTVHSAYDPQLDRRVALKLLRSSEGPSSESARQRMLREAQALARLSHPNVVPVHDAGLIDGQVFIVMEYVVGMTLRRWIEATQPSWSERLAVYLDAGRGLAAAHASGVIHRDFKPENAIRGDDGRVRVLDFGLARGVELLAPGPSQARVPPSARPSSGGALDALTLTGTVLGTPAYMAPEQFSGAKVGPAADQYAFCAALFEALYGRRPHSGSTFEALRAAVLGGELDEPEPGEIPRRLFQALRRGLARDPEQRFASIDELLDALASASRRRDRRLLAMVGGLGLALTLGVGMGSQREPERVEACSGADDALTEVWGRPQRQAVAAALAASGQAYAAKVGPRIEARLDHYAEDWATMQREACEVHRRAEQSDSVFDKRIVCLERRLSALASAVELLAAGELGPAKAVELVEQLPELETCARVELLAAEVPPPSDPARAAAAEQLRRRLIRAEAHERGGDLVGARELSEAVLAAARELDYDPVKAEAALVVGRVAALGGRPELASAALSEAATLGLRAHLDRVAVEAIARSLHVEGTKRTSASAVLAQLPLAEALAERLPEGAFVHALLLNNAGTVELAQGQPAEARALFERALAIHERAQLQAFELDSVLFNLALVTPEGPARAELSGRALARFEAALGPAHPLTLQARVGHSHQLTSLTDAIVVRSEACTLLTRFHPELGPVGADCLLSLGLLLAEQGTRGQAIEALDAAASLVDPDSAPSTDLSRTAALATAYAALHRNHHERALAEFDAIEARLAVDDPRWWISRDLAYAQLGRGQALRGLDRGGEARASFAAALARLEPLVELSHDLDLDLARARAHAALAELAAVSSQ